jgi:hypothetical protein
MAGTISKMGESSLSASIDCSRTPIVAPTLSLRSLCTDGMRSQFEVGGEDEDSSPETRQNCWRSTRGRHISAQRRILMTLAFRLPSTSSSLRSSLARMSRRTHSTSPEPRAAKRPRLDVERALTPEDYKNGVMLAPMVRSGARAWTPQARPR